MRETDNNTNSGIQQLGEYSLTRGALCGWDSFNPLKSRFFMQALSAMALFGLLSGISWYLFNTGMVDMRIRSMINHVASLALFVGGLLICEHLTARRYPLIIAFVLSSSLWQYIFCLDDKMKTLGVLTSSWLIIWWVITEPEIMEWYGLRKRNIVKDVFWGIVSVAVVLAYSVGLLRAFGYSFHFATWEIAATTTGHITFQLLIFMFFFMVLKKMSARGMDNRASVAIVALLAFLYQAPTFAAFFITGKIDLIVMMVGLMANTLILVIVMSVLFNLHKNVISAVCVETMVMVLLKAIGLI